MKKLILTIASVCLLPWLFPLVHAKEESSYYSLQVKAVPLAEQKTGLEVYESMKKNGYLAYYYTAEVDGKEWLRVRVGHFASKELAQNAGKELKMNVGIDSFADKLPLLVYNYQNKFDVITTPSGIWWYSASQNKELYPFGGLNSLELLAHTQAKVSPNGKEVVFYYDHQLIKVEVETATTQILVKAGVLNSAPAWSVDGKYIGYLDDTEWENPTSLCVIEVASLKNKCLVQNDSGTQRAVKSFHWHPSKNLIYFVEGHAAGTVSVGGGLYAVDLAGQRKNIVIARQDNREEISAEFFIKGNTINYQVVQFNSEYTETVSKKTQQVKVE